MSRSIPFPGAAAVRRWAADDTVLKRALTARRWMMRVYFEARYLVPDPWRLATSPYERERARATLGALGDRRYRSAVEVGCGEGIFTSQLLERCDRVVAVDFSALAVRRARRRFAGDPRVDVRRLDIREEGPAGMFDLVVCAEVFYYLSRAEREAVGRRLLRLVAPGGDVCLVHGTSAHDGACGAGTPARPGSVNASVIHGWFRHAPGLRLVRDLLGSRYRITLLRRIEERRG